MFNLLLGLGSGALVFVVVTALLGPVAAILPSVVASVGVIVVATRRTNRLVQAELTTVGPMLEQRRIDEAQTKLVTIKERYGRWQFLLAGQIDAQLGLIDYLQLKFEEARPKLESGKWRNAVALCCLGCIDWRRGRKDEAVKSFAAAAAAAPQDATVYLVWAALLARDGQQQQALLAVDQGVKALPENGMLKDLQQRIANKKKVDPGQLGEGWYQYFPEDYAQKLMMRGTRTPSPLLGKIPQPRFGARHAPRR